MRASRADRGPGGDREVLGGQPRRPGDAALGAPGEPPSLGVQVLGGPARGGGLRGVPLRLAQLGHGVHERGELGDQLGLGGAGSWPVSVARDSSRAAWRSPVPAGVRRGIRA